MGKRFSAFELLRYRSGNKTNQPKLKRHPTTILWIRFIEGGAISAFTKSVIYFKINILKTSVKIDFGLKRSIVRIRKSQEENRRRKIRWKLAVFSPGFCLLNFNC